MNNINYIHKRNGIMCKKLYDEILKYKPFNEKEEIEKDIMLDFIKNNNDVLTRDNKLAHFTTSAWITNMKRDKILMIYHNIYNSWAWVGGHADGNEDLFQAIRKEIAEETGITKLKPLCDGIFGLNIITVDNHFRRGAVC